VSRNTGRVTAGVHAGEVLLGDLKRSGFEVTSEHEAADAIVINTCAFVEDAKSESLEVRLWACIHALCRPCKMLGMHAHGPDCTCACMHAGHHGCRQPER
jgi:hypothetical protein